jgi:hypothetical protein
LRILDGDVEPVVEQDPVRQIGQHVAVGEAQYLFLARRDAVAHQVEAARQLAQLVDGIDRHRPRVIPFFDAARHLAQGTQGPRDAARDEHAAQD